jgi:hypothetical protein
MSFKLFCCKISFLYFDFILIIKIQQDKLSKAKDEIRFFAYMYMFVDETVNK